MQEISVRDRLGLAKKDAVVEHRSKKLPGPSNADFVPIASADEPDTSGSSILDSSALLGFLNFFSADIRDGFMPLLGAYLVAYVGWPESRVGYLATTMTACGLLATTPAGDIMDKTTHKKLLVGLCTLVCTVCSSAILVTHDFGPLMIAKALTGLSSAFLPPGITALTLGIVGPRGMVRQTTRNEVANHLGNFCFAGTASVLAYVLYPDCKNLFYLVVVSGMFSVLAIIAIPSSAINDDIARNAAVEPDQECNAIHNDALRNTATTGSAQEQPLDSTTQNLVHNANHSAIAGGAETVSSEPVSYGQIFKQVNFLLLIVSCMLFHLGNAVVLPLLGQVLAIGGGRMALAFAALCIVVAQVTMSLVAWGCGLAIGRVGFRRLLFIGFLSLPVRCALLVMMDRSDAPASVMLATQLLDGIGAGIFGVVTPLFVQALSHGTGRFNMMFGVLLTCQGVGASMSNIIGQRIAEAYGYDFAFFTMGMFGTLAVIVLCFVNDPQSFEHADYELELRTTIGALPISVEPVELEVLKRHSLVSE